MATRSGPVTPLVVAVLAGVLALVVPPPPTSRAAPSGAARRSAPLPSAGSDVTVSLSAEGATTVAQGVPIEVGATATNPDAVGVRVAIVFELAPSGPEPPVDFYDWQVTVPAGQSSATTVRAATSQWFVDQGTFEIIPLIEGVPAGDPLPFEVTAPTVVVPVFQDVTDETGLATTLPAQGCQQLGSGAAWGDANGDGSPDLYLPRRGEPGSRPPGSTTTATGARTCTWRTTTWDGTPSRTSCGGTTGRPPTAAGGSRTWRPRRGPTAPGSGPTRRR